MARRIMQDTRRWTRNVWGKSVPNGKSVVPVFS
jgi:hypothetical protein